MARERDVVLGRDEQWAKLNEAVPTGEAGSVLLLRGEAGVGKTTLVEAILQEWQRRGIETISIPTAWSADQYSVDDVIAAVRRRLDQATDSDLLGAVAAAVEWRQQTANDPESNLLPLVHELGRAVAEITRHKHTVVVIDDPHRMDTTLTFALPPLVQRLRAAGCLVLVSGRPEALPCWLDDLIDETVDLPPLGDDAVSAVLARWAQADGGRAALDSAVVTALRRDLGPLYGNPGTVLSTVRSLHDQGRLVAIDEHLCLWPSEEPIGLPPGHELVELIRGEGDAGKRFAALVAALQPVAIDDLSVLTAAAGDGLDPSGQVLDRLVAGGVLRVDERDRLRYVIPALATTLRKEIGEQPLRDLHAALARRLLAQLNRGAEVDSSRLADHLLHAESEIDDTGVDVLIEEADRKVDYDPVRAVEQYQAALHALPASDPKRPRLSRVLLRLRTSLGQYQDLARDINLIASTVLTAKDVDPVDGREQTSLVKVGLCWLSVLLHEPQRLGTEDSSRLFDSLDQISESAELRKLYSAMFAGEVEEVATLIDDLFRDAPWPEASRNPAELLRLLNAAVNSKEEFDKAWASRAFPGDVADTAAESLRESVALNDYATAVELLLGDSFVPRKGMLFDYQQLLRAYHTGDWDTALSLARESEVNGPEMPVRLLTRAFAAEICSERGDHGRAMAWLERIPAGVGGPLVSWVRCGVLYRSGRVEAALREGCQELVSHRQQDRLAGLERLLCRLIGYAVKETDRGLAENLLEELWKLDMWLGSRSSREMLLLMRGLLGADPETMREGMVLTRQRGDLPQVARNCVMIAGLSAEPRAWLHESYALARQFGSVRGRVRLHDVMRERGVAPPRTRGRQEFFSAMEKRIIDLVSDGLTNRQIAMSIQMSEKTVESHLTRLFARTGCRSRVELAAARLEGRLLAVGA